jgi:nucleoid-associated protein YgaU
MIGGDSRYAGCILYRDSTGEYLGRRERIDTTPKYDDRLHTVVEGDRIDLLAHRYLGDARLWWIICDYNDIFFPLELQPGTDLRIPSIENIQMRILG